MAEAKSGGKAHHGDTIVVKGGHKAHDDAHGGAWKVAFADFCLALLCLFLVLWLMAAREKEEIVQMMKASGAGTNLDEGKGPLPVTLGSPRGSMINREVIPRRGEGNGGPNTSQPLTAPEAAASAAEAAASAAEAAPKIRYESPADLDALAKELARLSLDAGLTNNLEAVVTPYGLRVMIHDTDQHGMFERGNAIPNARFGELLHSMGPLFARMENQMLIVGHTDSAQYADRSFAAFSNWTLSSNRAMAARARLMGGGMASNSILQVVGMADRSPMDAKNATAGVNRRIELMILTSPQARSIATMFGRPNAVQPLDDNLDTALPDPQALQALRSQLAPVPAPRSTRHAN